MESEDLTLWTDGRRPVWQSLPIWCHLFVQVYQLPEAPPSVVTAIEAKPKPNTLHAQDVRYPGDGGILQIPATQSHSLGGTHSSPNITLRKTEAHAILHKSDFKHQSSDRKLNMNTFHFRATVSKMKHQTVVLTNHPHAWQLSKGQTAVQEGHHYEKVCKSK